MVGGTRLLVGLSDPNAEVGHEIAKIARDSSGRIFEIRYKWCQTDPPLAGSVIRCTGVSRFARMKALEQVFEHRWSGDEPSLVRPPITSGFG